MDRAQMTDTSRSPSRSIAIVTLVVLVAMAIHIYSSIIALRISNQSVPLIGAVMEVKYELSLFHLWFEELVQQDPTVDRGQVWRHLNQARRYANAMLEGGENPEGRFQAVDEPALRSMIRKTLEQMDRFEAAGLERIERVRSSLAGSDQDQAFDRVFSGIIATADDIEAAVQRNMATQVRQFERLAAILGAVVVLVGLAGGSVLFLFERRRRSDYTFLLESKEQLRREQMLLRSLIDSIPDLIVFKDTEGVYLGCNKAFEEFAGRLESGIAGLTDLELFNPELGELYRENDRQILAEGKARRSEERVVYPDGGKVLLDVVKTPYCGPDGEVLGLIGTGRDITEKNNIEEKLRRREQSLSKAQRLAHIGSWELDLVQDRLEWSDEVFRIFEIDPGRFDASYDAFLDRLHPDDRELVDQAYTESVVNHTPYNINHRLLFGDGRIKYINERCETLCDETGAAVRSLGTVQDITTQVQAERSLRDSESRYRELIDAMSDGVAVYEVIGNGKDFIFKEHNRSGARITGMPREQVIGKPVRQAFPGIEEMGLFDVFQRVWRSGEPEHHPVKQYRDNKLTLWVENYVFKLPGGEIVAVYEDITERRQAEQVLRKSEQRLRTVVEHMPVILDAIDERGNILVWNSEAEKISGYSSNEMIGNPKAWELLYPDPEYREAMLADWRAQDDHRSWEWRLQAKDGSERFVEWSNISGRYPIPGWSSWGVGVDVTERKRAEEALRTLNRELEDRVRARTTELQMANKELESFAYSVSHDLRAPLRAIDGFSLALVEDYGAQLDEAAHDYLKRVRNGAQRMGMLIDDLLKLSRVSRGELSPQQAHLSRIAESVLEELRAGEPERRVEWTLDPNMLVQGDPRLLRVMLDNLLGNAWKFTSRETVARIAFERKTDDPRVFYISDNGVGFDMHHADKLFGAFQRLHRINDFPGTGIGLATVQRIVHRHSGRIWAEAIEGEGATFYFSLGPA